MFRLYISFFKQLLFWLLFFALGRLVFISFYIADIWFVADSFSEILMSFQKGFKLDWATASYFMFIPFFIHLIQIFFSPPFLNKINKIYHWVLIILYSLLVSSELGIYAEWKTKINYKALLYLRNPSEVINSAQTSQMIGLLILMVLLSGFGIWLYAKVFHTSIIRIQSPWLVSLSFFLFIPPLLVIGARGGLQEIPINQSQSYFSKHAIINSAATNSVFNLYISFHENQKSLTENPFLEMPTTKAQDFVKQLYAIEKDTTTSVLSHEKPNVVLIIMESWSADLVFIPEGKAVVTPNFRKMMSEGIYFDQIYATGPRSEQGMASIFSGFPATPISSVTVQPDKYNKLPSMVKDFNNQGYHSSFYFAGQLIYGNIKSFIIFNQFDQIKEVYDFDQNLPQGKLGIHDEFSLHEMITDLKTVKQPFFSSLFTISTHSPYDQPMEEKIFWGGNNQQYLNGAFYTDYSIGKFIEEAKQQDWYDNTLF
ncbi:MAG: sulfatase-like hydrolase/transferase, partial [Bacteroidales bacterium]|nr:sulfatase-like hydrolase/transferase [Bacteroidales bacterium]